MTPLTIEIMAYSQNSPWISLVYLYLSVH